MGILKYRWIVMRQSSMAVQRKGWRSVSKLPLSVYLTAQQLTTVKTSTDHSFLFSDISCFKTILSLKSVSRKWAENINRKKQMITLFGSLRLSSVWTNYNALHDSCNVLYVRYQDRYLKCQWLGYWYHITIYTYSIYHIIEGKEWLSITLIYWWSTYSPSITKSKSNLVFYHWHIINFFDNLKPVLDRWPRKINWTSTGYVVRAV